MVIYTPDLVICETCCTRFLGLRLSDGYQELLLFETAEDGSNWVGTFSFYAKCTIEIYVYKIIVLIIAY